MKRCLCLFLTLTAWAAPQQQKHTAAATGMSSMAAMPLVAPLFIQNGQLSTTVTVVNAMARASTVDVILLDQTGNQIASQTYPLDGHTQQVVNVGDLLATAKSGLSVGSVKIETDAEAEMNMGVLGQVSIAGSGRGAPVYLEEEFPMMGPHDSGVLRAVAPAGLGFPVLALRSTSTVSQTVTVSCLYEHGGVGQRTVQLAPGQMVLSGACAAVMEQLASLDAGWNQQTLDSKGAAGISVASSAGAGALCVYGFLFAGQAGSPIYTALNFIDAGAMNSGDTVFAGAPVGPAEPLGGGVFAPALALTNFGTTPVKATVTFAVTGGNGPNGNTVATVTVAGQSSVTVPLRALSGDHQTCGAFRSRCRSAQVGDGDVTRRRTKTSDGADCVCSKYRYPDRRRRRYNRLENLARLRLVVSLHNTSAVRFSAGLLTVGPSTLNHAIPFFTFAFRRLLETSGNCRRRPVRQVGTGSRRSQTRRPCSGTPRSEPAPAGTGDGHVELITPRLHQISCVSRRRLLRRWTLSAFPPWAPPARSVATAGPADSFGLPSSVEFDLLAHLHPRNRNSISRMPQW